MKKKDVPAMLRRIGIPMAYDHFAEGESPDPPFLVFLFPHSDNFSADGIVYQKIDALHVELYTDKKVRDGKLRFVLENGIGDVVCFGENEYATPIHEDEVRNIIDKYFE